MIERYVFVKLGEQYATPEQRAVVEEETLRALPNIPGVLSVTVGQPADEAARKAWDLSIVVRFAELAAVEPYRSHPAHRDYVDKFLRPRMVVIKAWNFDVQTA